MDATERIAASRDEEASTSQAPPKVESSIPQHAAGPEAVMPVADVMNLLRAMREEQMGSLNTIADGVQQLQSQVMVLGETTSAAGEGVRVCLDRLAALEVRIGSIPLPMKAPERKPVAGGGSSALAGRGGFARIPDFSAQSAPSAGEKGAAPMPPPPAPGPARVPRWLGKDAELEQSRPHFMRTVPQTQAASVAPSAAGTTTTTQDSATLAAEEAAKEAQRNAFAADRLRMQARIAARRAGGSTVQPTATTSSSSSASPAPASAPSEDKPGTVKNQPRGFESSGPLSSGAVAGPGGLRTAFAAGGGHGAFSGGGNAFLSDAPGGPMDAGGAGGEDQAAWLEREKEARERKEKERREVLEREKRRREEEEARLERQRAEARRLREEEEARLAREAEEARAREKARRELAEKRKAKTRDIMSSLFDKDDAEAGGNSLFGGLGAALPAGSSVFEDSNNGLAAGAEPMASVSAVREGGGGGSSSGGGLFAGIDGNEQEPSTGKAKGGGGGGMFDALDTPASPGSEGFASPLGAVSRIAGSNNAGAGGPLGSAAGGGLFDAIDSSDSQPRGGGKGGAVAGVGGLAAGGRDSGGLFDASPAIEAAAAASSSSPTTLGNAKAEASASVGLAGPAPAAPGGEQTEEEDEEEDEIEKIFSNEHGPGYGYDVYTPADPVDEYDDFLSTPPSSIAGAGDTNASGGASAGHGSGPGADPAPSARGSIFEDGGIGQFGYDDYDDEDVFASPAPHAEVGRVSLGRGGKGGGGLDIASKASVGGGGSGDSGLGVSRSTSLFDRPEFSIDPAEDDRGAAGGGAGAGNLFGVAGVGRGGGSGGPGGVGIGDVTSTSFLSALDGDADLDLPPRGKEEAGAGRSDREGMVDVTL